MQAGQSGPLPQELRPLPPGLLCTHAVPAARLPARPPAGKLQRALATSEVRSELVGQFLDQYQLASEELAALQVRGAGELWEREGSTWHVAVHRPRC